MKVLVVDDALFMRVSLKNMLLKNGHEVIGEACNGLEAIEKYNELKPDLVTMDITMPEMDGIESVKGIIQADKKAKIVMITAMGQERCVKEAIMSGAKGFIVKPFVEETLIKSLKCFM